MQPSRSLLALPVLLGLACGGNVVGTDRATLAAMQVPPEAGVAVSDVELKVVELRRDDGTRHTIASTCDGTPGQVTLGPNHFEDVAPGESIWHHGTQPTAGKPGGETKQCDLTIRAKEGETSAEVARSCYRSGTLTDGACG